MAVIRCQARAKSGRRCNRFVAELRGPVRVIGIVTHSREAEDGHDVVPCSSCGALHEVAREREPANAS